MEEMEITDFRQFFDLDDHQLYKAILKASNNFGVKIMHESNDRILIDPKIFESVEVVYTLLRKNIPIAPEALINSSEKIPFKDGSYIYFLVNYTEIVYIGQAVNLGARIPNHFTDKKFDKVQVITEKRLSKMSSEKCIVILEGFSYNELLKLSYDY